MHQLAVLPSAGTCAALLLAAAVVSLLTRSSLALWTAAAFAFTVHAASDRLATRLTPADDGRDWRVAGWVDGIPAVSAARTVFSLRVDRAGDLANARLRLSWYDTPVRIEPGSRLELTVRLRHPRGYVNPHGFDYERWLFLEGYAATGYVRRAHGAATVERTLGARLLRWRWQLAERVRAAVADPDGAAILTALTLGERSGVSDALWSVLRRSGTSHLIAISGLHISLISGLCFAALAALVRRMRSGLAAFELEIALAGAVLAGLVYAALAGFALPTRRAAIMVAFAALVVLSRRRIGALNGLGVALVLVLVLDPLATLGASFWMSFAAVAVLLICALPRRVCRAQRRTALRARIAYAVRLQCHLTLALVPLSAAFFSGVSLLAVPANLIAIPIFCLGLIPLSLVAVAGLAVAPDFTLLVDFAGHACTATAALLTRAAALPAALIETAPARSGVLALAVLGVALAMPWHRSPGRAAAWLALLPLFFPRVTAPEPGVLDVWLLDVGHGLAMVLTTRRHRMVYDAGPAFRSGYDAGAEVLVPLLRADRARYVDLLVISHADVDHSGGAAAVLRAYPTAQRIVGPDVALENARVCTAGERWEWDGIAFEFLHPQRDFAPRGNDSSCVLRVDTPTQSLLVTGDIERAAESALAHRGGLDVDVVIVPHHGSATSSSAGLVAATTPALALVSAGHGNRWGFPVEDVRRRWQQVGAQLHVTGDRGAIGLRLGGSAPVVTLARDAHRRYWRAE